MFYFKSVLAILPDQLNDLSSPTSRGLQLGKVGELKQKYPFQINNTRLRPLKKRKSQIINMWINL